MGTEDPNTKKINTWLKLVENYLKEILLILLDLYHLLLHSIGFTKDQLDKNFLKSFTVWETSDKCS